MAKISINLLTKEDREKIHTSTLELLQNVGLVVMDDEALAILEGAKAFVDWDKKNVRFPPALVEDSLSKAPSEVRLFGRNTDCSILIKPGNVFYTTSGYALYLYESEKGRRRPIDQVSLAWLTRLADSMDQMDIYSVMATPNDAPSETNDRYQLAIALENTTKHIWNTAYGKEGVQDAVRLAAIVRKGREALRKYPLITLDLTTLSPLQLDKRQASTMVEGARQFLPIGISSGTIAGATGPVNLIGTMVQANAEVLGAITLCQVVQPGVPVIYTQWTRNLDMGTGNISMGGPEFSLLRIATAEMAKHYEVPSRGGGLFSDSKIADEQLGAEKMMNCLSSSLAGLGVVAGMGMAGLSNTICPNLLLIDNEIIRVVRQMLKGISVNAETMAREIIVEVGFGGNYLIHEHTALNFRDELWFTKIWDRKVWSTWEEEGAYEISERTHQMINNLQHEPPALDDGIKHAIWEVVHAADQRIGTSNIRIS